MGLLMEETKTKQKSCTSFRETSSQHKEKFIYCQPNISPQPLDLVSVSIHQMADINSGGVASMALLEISSRGRSHAQFTTAAIL